MDKLLIQQLQIIADEFDSEGRLAPKGVIDGVIETLKRPKTNWKTLRYKFFRECTDDVPAQNGLPRVNLTPHNLFEWFKREINNES